MKRIYTLLTSLFVLATSASWAQTQASGITFEPVPGTPTSLKINWTEGTTTAGRIVVVKDAFGTFKPSNGTDITTLGANNNYTAATDKDAGSGVVKIVAAIAGAGASVTVSNLVANSRYFVQIYEFTGTAASPTYLLTTNATNPRSVTFYTSNGSFSVPLDVTSVRVQAWGAGGGGGGANGTGTATTERGGGGGAGGSYTLSNSVAVTAGASVPLTIGTGGTGGIGATPTDGGTGGTTTFSSAAPINAVGGLGGTTGTSGDDTGAGAAATVGVTFNGGAGATAPGTNPDAASGGGGGGGAGTTGSGGNATNATAGAAGANGGGIGAAGQTGTAAGISATEISGGGGGAYTMGSSGDVNVNGGAGGAGFMIVSFNDNTVPIVTSINRQTPAGSPVNATTVTFQVTFNEPVTNVTFDDFANGGTAGAGTISVSPVSSSVYNIQISGLSSGTVDLNFVANDIVDLSNNAFGGTINSEQTYTLDTSVPTILTAVASPATGLLKIGDQVVITLTAGGGETGLVAGAGSTVNGQAATFNEVGGGTYTFTYTIASTNANWVAGALPFSLILNDGVNNSTAQTTFTTANTMAGDANAPTNQNTIFSANRAATPGGTLTIVAGTATDFNFLAPTGTTSFVANGTTITSAAGNATSITAPTTEGDYQLFVVDPAGNYSAASTATLSVFTQASITVANFIAPGANTQLNFGWSNGSGGNRLVILKTNGATGYTINPGTTYAPNLAFGSGTDLNGATAGTVKSIYDGTTSALSAPVTGLTAGTTYTIEIYEYKGTKVYLSPPATINRSTPNGTNPGTASTAMVFSNITGTSMDVQFTQGGTGSSSVLIARAGAAVSFTPTDGVSYSPSLDYTAGFDLGSGNKIIAYRPDGSSGTPISVSGLNPDVVYHFAVFEMNGTAGDGSENYSTVNLIGNRSTEPSTLPTPQAFTGVSETAMTLNWTNTGNGDRRIVVMRPGAAITASEHPTDYTTYTASSNFNFGAPTGTAIGAGYVVYDNTGTSVSITNLLPGITYHFAIFEYNNTTSQGAPNQAFLTPGATASQATNVDATNPSNAFTVGALTPVGGRVVKNGATTTYWNSTNTQLNVVVPLTAADGTLDGGTVQVKLRMTGGAFANIPSSGLSIITAGERAAGTKTITINQADLENVVTGFTEGNVSGLFSSETKYMLITAETSDLTGNLSGNYTTSTTQIDVDQTAPGISGSVKVSPQAGGGNKDAILFQMNEILSDHATTPVERAHNFAFISASNNYGNPGISVDDGNTDDVKYFNDGAVNAIDGSFTNTRLIRIISAANSSTWDVANATNVQYVQLGTGSTAAAVMRDPAGNEFGAITVPVVTGSQTTLAAATAVAGPNLNNGSTNQAVFAFALTPTANATLQALSIISTVDPTNKLKNFKLFSNSVDNFATASVVVGAPTVITSAPFGVNFNTLTVNLTAATTTYFFLMADVEDYFFSNNPTIAFSMAANGLPNAAGGFTISSGGVAGTNQTGTTYTLKDLTAPSILSMTNTVNPIFEGALTQTVNVVYSEPMNTATNPAITISGANWGASAPSGGTNGWFTTTLPNDSYKATLVHNGTQELNATATSTVAALANGTDWAGNKNTLAANSAASFVLDTQKPTATLTAVTTATPTSLLNAVNNVLTIQATFSEAMNTSVAPVISFAPANANFTNGAGIWSGGNTIYTIVYTHTATLEEIPSINVNVNSAKDANGNTQTTQASSTFTIDNKRPTVSSITRSGVQFTNGPSVTYNVVFNEAVSGVNESDFTPVAINGTVSTGTIFPGGVSNPSLDNKTFVVVVQGLTGDGDVRLDVVNGTASINDSNGNSFNTTFNTGEIFSIDNTAPTITSIAIDPAVINPYAVSVNGVTPSLHGNIVDYIVTFSEPVNGLDLTFNDFNGLKYPNVSSTINLNPGSINPVGPAPATQWRLSANYVSGAGTFEVDFNPASNSSTVPLQSGATVIKTNIGSTVVNRQIGPTFIGLVFPGYDIYTTGNQYIGTVLCCVSPSSFILQNPASIAYTATYNFDPTPTDIGFGTGSVTATSGSNTLTGSGTAFPVDLRSGDLLFNFIGGQYIGTVQSISSPTLVQLTSPSTITYSGSYAIRRPTSILNSTNIKDQAGNLISSAYLAGDFYNFSLDEPAQAPALSSTTTTTSVKATWTDVSGATGYLVMLRDNVSGPAFPVVTDGTYINDVTNFTSSGVVLVKNILQGVGSADFDGLPTSLVSGKVYQVTIYPYSLDPNTIIGTDKHAINYNTTVVPAATITPSTTVGSTTTITSVTVPGASPLSSIVDDAPAGQSQNVFAFKITDDGSANNDNAPTKFSQIIIRQSGGTISDWTQALGTNQAELVASSGGPAITGTVANISPGINTITFNIPNRSNPGDFGFISDGANKDYTLRIWLKTSLGGTLPVTIDGASFGFSVTAADIALDNTTNNQQSSKFLTVPVQTVNSPLITVAVSATVMTFNTNLPATIGVKATFPTPPVVEAKDANGNRDTNGYVAATAYTITLGGTLTASTGTDNWAAGILTLNNFNFTSPGTGNITISAAGITTPAISDSNSGLGGNQPTQAVITGLSQVSAVASSEPATISSLGTVDPALVASAPQTNGVQNWSFTITDDVGATALLDDKLPTIINSISITRNNFNGITGGADALTFDDWTNTIAGAQLSLGANKVNGTVNAGSLDFALPPVMQTVADGGANTYVLKIWLKNPVATALKPIIDGKDFVFDVVAASGITTGASPSSSTMQAGTASSLDGKNGVAVLATQIDFVTQWASNANQDYDAPLTPTPTALANDANGNLDLGFNTAVNVATATPITYPLANSAVSVNNGSISFNSNLQVTSAGGGLNGAATNLVLTTGAFAGSYTSNSFKLNYSGSSDIVRDTFIYPTDILYASVGNQTAGAITNTTGTALERFLIRDGGVSNDADGSPTKLTAITLNVTNWQNLNHLALFDGNTLIKDLDVATSINTITGDIIFNSFTNPFSTPDNNIPSASALTVKATFKGTGVIDNQVITFRVVSVTAAAVSSSQFGNTTPAGIQSTASGNQNAIEVVATQLDFTTQPPSSVSTFTALPTMIVSARDVFTNLDVDYIGTVSNTAPNKISNTGTTGTGPSNQLLMTNIPAGNFVAGIFNLATVNSLFQFEEDSGLEPGQNVTLKVPVVTNNQLGALPTVATSIPFKVIGSYESWMYFDPLFTYTSQIDFIPFTNTTTTSSSFALAKVILSDGGAPGTLVNPGGVKNLPKGSHNDSDGGPTKINSFSFSLTNNLDVKAIGLYKVDGTKITEVTNPGPIVTFSSLSAYFAQDDDVIAYVIRAEFDKSVTLIDQHQFTLQITDVVPNSGSKFPEDKPAPAPATVAGMAVGDSTPTNVNFLNVIATSLDFTNQPTGIAGLAPSPVGLDPLLTNTAGKVTARDNLGNIDTNFATDPVGSGGIVLTDGNGKPIAPPAGLAFNLGVIDLKGMIYSATGNGKVRVQTKNSAAVLPIPTTLDSKNPINDINSKSIDCFPINVINTTVAYDASTTPLASSPDATGQANLKGGKTGLSIFGLKFSSTGGVGAEPILRKFTIGFKTGTHSSAASAGNQWYYNSNTAVTVFNPAALRVLYNGVDVTSKGGIVTSKFSTNPGEFDLIEVDLTAFSDPPTTVTPSLASNVNIVLQVDVSSTTNGATQTLIPYLVDAGFGSASDGNIIVSNGTATSIGSTIGIPNISGALNEIDGIEYNFASASPPKLLADINIYPTTLTRPYTPQPNVDPVNLSGGTKPQITLQFDTNVGVLDAPTNGATPTGSIYDRNTNQKVADLYLDTSLANGQKQATVSANGQTINNNAVYGKLIFNVCDIGNPSQSLTTPLTKDHVYYVNIVAGKYDQSLVVKGSGIADLQLNFYGGVTNNFTLYFKTWSNTAPIITDVTSPFSTTSLGTLSANFNELGTAYYLVMPHNAAYSSSTFTATQIKTAAVAHVNTTTSVLISQLGVAGKGPFQIFEFPATLSPAQDYDVFMVSENNANPTVSSSVYYFSKVIMGTQITDPTTSTQLIPSVPLYKICPDSYSTLTQPIVITENSSDSKTALRKADQTVNIQLPTGYEYDTKTIPTILLGPGLNDFTNITAGLGAGTKLHISYSSNTILQIRFSNTGISNYDYISISGLRVIGKRAALTGTLPSQGDIVWFYGNDALTSAIPSKVPLKLATIGINVPTTVPKFDNTYWKFNHSISPYHTNFPTPLPAPPGVKDNAATYMSQKVNAIPDNYGGIVRLEPNTSSFNITADYLASTFTGSGVSGDILTLSAVSLDAPFNITMDHTDVNGCAYSLNEQYIVYDHIKPISGKLGSTANLNPATNLPFTQGTVQDIVNTNFTSNSSASSSLPLPSITKAEKAGYQLLELQADLPISEIALNQASKSSQLISGNAWRTLVQSLPINNFSSGAFVSANWDYATILNANSATVSSTPFTKPSKVIPPTGPFPNVYDYFKQQSSTGSGDFYWTGGSLGKIEFTGLYMNSADNSIFVPYRQEVELFIPAVPLIEVQSGKVTYDLTDPNKFPSANNTLQYPNNYRGTVIACELGGSVSFIGHPQALGGTSVGKFNIYDYSSYNFTTNTGTKITTGFTDNNNGTMTLDPANAGIINTYNDILITYTYQENNSPAIGTGYLVVRVAPNPVTKFTQTSIGANAFTPSAICVKNQIDFDASASSLGGVTPIPPSSIMSYAWDFGDPNSAVNNQSTLATPNHTFNVSSTYPVSLTIVSNFGCTSIPFNSAIQVTAPLVQNVIVGEIPVPKFDVTKNCVGEGIGFDAKDSAVPSGGPASNIATYKWIFNAPTTTLPNPSPATSSFSVPTASTTYSQAGFYKVQLTTISSLGCQNSITKPISQLEVTSAFSTNFDNNDGKWQALDLAPIALNNPPIPSTDPTSKSSWVWNPTTGRTNPVFNSTPAGNKLWSLSGNGGSYYPFEKSALYSSCLDLDPTKVPRPMISFSSFVDVKGGDGLVLQYSTDDLNIMDPNKVWANLGTTASGISPGLDWFDQVGISATPGGNSNGVQTGWTTSGNKWIRPKHRLEEINGAKAILRFAFATNSSTNTTNGVGIDSVFFGSRTRTILFENFTTTDGGTDTSPLSLDLKSDAAAISAFNTANIGSTQVVNINYHIGFEGKDPFNLDNPADPSSRALYYNVTKVPYAFLDAKHSSSFSPPNSTKPDLFGNWGQAAYNLQTLQLGNADFTGTTVTNKSDGSIEVNVKVKPLQQLPLTTKLHIGILETKFNTPATLPAGTKITTGETSFEYVLKKLLPSAVGTSVGALLQNNVNNSVVDLGTQSWTPSSFYSSRYSVVVFLQDEVTKEVYQAELNPGILPPNDYALPPPVTGLEPLSPESVNIYPNPANQEFVIELPKALSVDANVSLVDQMGRTLDGGLIPAGRTNKSIGTYDLAAGVYIVQIKTDGGEVVRKKVVIVH